MSFAIYTFTLCPTIYWEDSAAFSAVHSVLGIPHSPGFPIYVILGKIFTLLPIENPAFMSNLMSAFWGSLSLVILYLLIHSLRQVFNSSQDSKSLTFQLPIIASVLFFAFSSSFWLQTIRAEVYTLNIFLTLCLIFLLIRWSQGKDVNLNLKILILFSFVLGISLANHPLLIVTLLPAFIGFLFTQSYRWIRGTNPVLSAVDPSLTLDLKKIPILLIFFLLGISLYLYLPIRSSMSPPINWGKPDTWSGLLSYLMRTSQSSALLSDSDIPYLNRLGFNLSFPVDQFGLAFFWLGVVGAISMFKFYRRIFLCTFLIFILNVLTATWATDFSLRNYDLLGYLLPSLSMFTIWFAFGMFFILSFVSDNVRETLVVSRMKGGNPATKQDFVGFKRTFPHILKLLLYCLILLLPLFQIIRNSDQCNKRSNIWAYQYAEQILNSVKKNALILVGDDNTLTPLWYLNLSQGIRPDVRILSITALKQKSYREQISHQYGEIKLPKVESKDLGEMAYEVSQLNSSNLSVYPTHFSIYPLFIRHLRPVGYIFEFDPQKVILTDKNIEDQKGFLKKNLENKNFDPLTREHFGNLIFNLGAFYDQLSIGSKSIEYFLWALEIDPSNARIYFQLGKAFLKNGDKAKALDFFQAGLEIDPYNLEAKKLLEKT